MLKTYQGSCHCGDVRFECELDLSEVTSKCNCSICAKSRFWKAIARAGRFRLLQGAEKLSEYRFGSNNIQHRFCSRCGVKVFGRGHHEQLGGEFYAVSVPCLEGVPDADLAAAPVLYEDGRNNRWDSPPAETRHL